jgi:hypothetical protein
MWRRKQILAPDGNRTGFPTGTACGLVTAVIYLDSLQRIVPWIWNGVHLPLSEITPMTFGIERSTLKGLGR